MFKNRVNGQLLVWGLALLKVWKTVFSQEGFAKAWHGKRIEKLGGQLSTPKAYPRAAHPPPQKSTHGNRGKPCFPKKISASVGMENALKAY